MTAIAFNAAQAGTFEGGLQPYSRSYAKYPSRLFTRLENELLLPGPNRLILRQFRDAQSNRDRAMIAMQLMNPNLSGKTQINSTTASGQEREFAGILPPGETALVATQFKPLDGDIISDAIPAFFVGRNKEGFWVAREAKGRIGGLFLLKSSALSFAKCNSLPTGCGCATIQPSDLFELDLENRGNPLVPHLGSLKRLALRAWQRTAALIGG